MNKYLKAADRIFGLENFIGITAAAGLAIGLAGTFNNPLWQDKEGAAETLADAGFKPVEVGGYAWLGCGLRDRFKTEFTAVNPEGQEIQGVICRGIQKGSTIRFDN